MPVKSNADPDVVAVLEENVRMGDASTAIACAVRRGVITVVLSVPASA
jgi:hypothetical protein